MVQLSSRGFFLQITAPFLSQSAIVQKKYGTWTQFELCGNWLRIMIHWEYCTKGATGGMIESQPTIFIDYLIVLIFNFFNKFAKNVYYQATIL